MINQIAIYKKYNINFKFRGKLFLNISKDLSKLKKFFNESFSNHQQYIRDLKIKNSNNSWGNHESIACYVIDLSNKGYNYINAYYFFNKVIENIFRIRIYNLESSMIFLDLYSTIIMKINNFNTKDKAYGKNYRNLKLDMITNCELFWFKKPINHNNEFFFIGKMNKDGCSLYSHYSNNYIIIKDELIISEHFLQISDHGFDYIGNKIYGSYDNISYDMKQTRRGIL